MGFALSILPLIVRLVARGGIGDAVEVALVKLLLLLGVVVGGVPGSAHAEGDAAEVVAGVRVGGR